MGEFLDSMGPRHIYMTFADDMQACLGNGDDNSDGARQSYLKER